VDDLERLRRGLAAADARYQKASKPRRPEIKRRAAIEAIEAVGAFAVAQGMSWLVLARIKREFDNIDDGHQPPDWMRPESGQKGTLRPRRNIVAVRNKVLDEIERRGAELKSQGRRSWLKDAIADVVKPIRADHPIFDNTIAASPHATEEDRQAVIRNLYEDRHSRKRR
jgi:hypothetical protein